jgi:4-alpha-glucanotransferase
MNTMIVTFSIHYRTTPGQQLCITGSTNGLGQWNVAQALRMHYTHDGHWTVQLNVAETEGVLEYKYLILDLC